MNRSFPESNPFKVSENKLKISLNMVCVQASAFLFHIRFKITISTVTIKFCT